jgi:membrane protein involved in colicin uptake
MKIYSEQLNKFYDTVEACQKDEAAYAAKVAEEKAKKEQELALAKQKKEQALAERKAAAGKVDAARQKYSEAYEACKKAEEELKKELQEFCGKYQTYHYSLKDGEELPSFMHIPSVFEIFNNLFKF